MRHPHAGWRPPISDSATFVCTSIFFTSCAMVRSPAPTGTPPQSAPRDRARIATPSVGDDVGVTQVGARLFERGTCLRNSPRPGPPPRGPRARSPPRCRVPGNQSQRGHPAARAPVVRRPRPSPRRVTLARAAVTSPRLATTGLEQRGVDLRDALPLLHRRLKCASSSWIRPTPGYHFDRDHRLQAAQVLTRDTTGAPCSPRVSYSGASSRPAAQR